MKANIDQIIKQIWLAWTGSKAYHLTRMSLHLHLLLKSSLLTVPNHATIVIYPCRGVCSKIFFAPMRMPKEATDTTDTGHHQHNSFAENILA